MNFITIVNNIADDIQDTSAAMILRIKRQVNKTQQDICSNDFDFLYKESSLQCTAPYTTGTITATQGSKTITGSGTTFTSAMVGRKISILGSSEIYDIEAFVSVTEITLKQSFVNQTTAGLTYSIYQDVYSLDSDVDSLKFIISPYSSRPLTKLNRYESEQYFANPAQFGVPLYYAEAGSDANGNKKIQLYNIPSSNYIFPYKFRRVLPDLSGDNDISIIPAKYHELLELGGKARVLKNDENDNSVIFDTDYTNLLEQMKIECLSNEDRIPVMGGQRRRRSGSTLRLDPSHFRN